MIEVAAEVASASQILELGDQQDIGSFGPRGSITDDHDSS